MFRLPLLCGLLAAGLAAVAETNRTVIIVLDGVRPDYITPAIAPNIVALGERGVTAETHSVTYPTYTRPNSASVSTGAYPKTHGIMQNTMYHPAMGDDPFNVGSAAALQQFDAATGGRMLTSPTLGEVLDANGKVFFVAGTAGSGTTLLQNPRGAGRGTWHAGGLFFPEDAEEEAIAALGPLPESRATDEATNWAFDAYLHHAVGAAPPDVTLVWINQPDATGHREGVGAPETLAAVTHADANIGRLLAAHEAHGLTDQVNVIVTTDHGFSTTTGGLAVLRTLREAGIDDDAIGVVRNMVWVENDDLALLVRVGQALQQDESVGAIYTRPREPGSPLGVVPGTLSTAVIQWDHPERAADLIASPSWTHDANEFGFPGTTTFGGRATHGSDSPYDLRVWMVAAGPDFKQGLQTRTPTGNVDLAPTVLHLLGIAAPAEMDGRIWHELLAGGPDPAEVPVETFVHRAETQHPDGLTYEVEMETRRVGTTVYLRGAQTQRSR